MRASQRKIRRATREEKQPDYSHTIYLSPRKRSRTIQALPRIYAPHGQRFTQNSNLPLPSGQVGLLEGIGKAIESIPFAPKLRIEATSNINDDPVVISLHQRKRIAQNNRWNTEVIPRLVRPYLRLLRKTQNLRNDPPAFETQCTCLTPRRCLSILVVRIYSKQRFFFEIVFMLICL